ncbi:hypothetical protein ACHWQZ_G006512 [Mnemiopsis leidyi]
MKLNCWKGADWPKRFFTALVLFLLHKLIMSFGDEYDSLLPEDEQQVMPTSHVLAGPEQFSDDVFVNYSAYFPENTPDSALPRSSCQMANPGPSSTAYFPSHPVRGLTSSPLRKKPHILKEEPGTQGFEMGSCKSERVEPQPSSSSSNPSGGGRRNRTMADLLLSGDIPFSPLERPNTEAARIFYNAPDTPPILPIDPHAWSVAEVMLWLRWCSRRYEIPNIDPHMFGFNGKAVCVMTKAMFEYRVPHGNGALILYTEIKNRKKHAAIQKEANEMRHRKREQERRQHDRHATG